MKNLMMILLVLSSGSALAGECYCNSSGDRESGKSFLIAIINGQTKVIQTFHTENSLLWRSTEEAVFDAQKAALRKCHRSMRREEICRN